MPFLSNFMIKYVKSKKFHKLYFFKNSWQIITGCELVDLLFSLWPNKFRFLVTGKKKFGNHFPTLSATWSCTNLRFQQNGNIFLLDYKLLDGVKANVIDGKQQYLMAPLVLLHSTPDHKLMPVAIQVRTRLPFPCVSQDSTEPVSDVTGEHFN